MRDIINGQVFEHKKKMDDNFIKSRIVRGGSGKVAHTMKSEGWDTLMPSCGIAVSISKNHGSVNAPKLVTAGTSKDSFSTQQPFSPVPK